MKKYIFVIMLILLMLPQTACMKLTTTQDIADVYYTNEELFKTATDVLMSYRVDNLMSIKKNIHDFRNAFIYKIHDIYITTKQALLPEDYQRIYDTVLPLFEEIPTLSIYVYATCINFHLESHAGRTAELYYEITDNSDHISTSYEITDKLRLEKNWYAITTSD